MTVQRLIQRLYERLGPRVVPALIIAAWAVTIVTAALMVLIADRYLDFTYGEAIACLAVAEAVALVGPASIMFSVRNHIRRVLMWSGDARTRENAPAAWEAVATYPAAIARVSLPLSVAYVCASVIFVAVLMDFPAWTVPLAVLACATAVAGACVVVVFGVEYVMRPMLEEIAAHLPPDFEPTHRGWSIHAKALVPLPVITIVAAVGVGGFVDLVDGGPERLAITFSIAMVIVAVATAIFFIITRSSLDPVVDLTAAAERVGEGDLSTTVPVVTADDLGHLAATFNRMMLQLRESQARIVAASDASRRQVERDLHDGAQQELVLLNLKLGMLERAAAGDEKLAGLVSEIRADLARALQQLRDLAHGIYPAALENDGLTAALTDAAQRSGIPVTVESDGAGRYPRDLEAAVYFCCLEALQNAAKHGGPGASATVRLAAREGRLEFEVADTGPGFAARAGPAAGGLQNMADRIGALGGVLRVDSAPGAGTTVKGSVPAA